MKSCINKNLKKRSAVFIIAFFIILNISSSVLAAMPKLEASEGAFIYEATTDTVLYEHNSDKKKYPASTTKIMTAILTIENVENLNDTVVIGDELNKLPPGSSTAGLIKGEEMRYRDLLYGLMLPSGNDAAIVLAVHAGRIMAGDKNLSANKAYQYFVKEMNNKVDELGLIGTHFSNPHGFHDKNHYSTARDMTMLGVYASQNKTYSDVVKTKVRVCITNKATHNWYNTNQLLFGSSSGGADNKYYYRYANGAKTGYTDKAKRCLVFSSKKDGNRVYGTVLHSGNTRVFTVAKDLLVSANNDFSEVEVGKKGKTHYVAKLSNSAFTSLDDVRITTNEDMSAFIKTSKKDNVSIKFIPHENLLKEDEGGSYTINEEITKAQAVGRVDIYAGKDLIKSYEAVARNAAVPAGPYDVYIENLAYIMLFFCLAVAVIIAMYFIKHNKVRKKKGKKRKKVRHSTLERKKRRYNKAVAEQKKKKPRKKVKVVYNKKKKTYPRRRPRRETKR